MQMYRLCCICSYEAVSNPRNYDQRIVDERSSNEKRLLVSFFCVELLEGGFGMVTWVVFARVEFMPPLVVLVVSLPGATKECGYGDRVKVHIILFSILQPENYTQICTKLMSIFLERFLLTIKVLPTQSQPFSVEDDTEACHEIFCTRYVWETIVYFLITHAVATKKLIPHNHHSSLSGRKIV